MISNKKVESRRAIEALRAGVPNRDAVRALGSSQPQLEKIFRERLSGSREGFSGNRQIEGLLITGDFGSGKSHLLEYFKHIALEENFVCSKKRRRFIILGKSSAQPSSLPSSPTGGDRLPQTSQPAWISAVRIIKVFIAGFIR
jgi:predicted NACHT family NTPase